MKKAIASVFLLVGAGLTLGGCVAQETVVARPAHCARAVWIPGGYGPRGRWHHGRWRCAGRVVVVEGY